MKAIRPLAVMTGAWVGAWCLACAVDDTPSGSAQAFAIGAIAIAMGLFGIFAAIVTISALGGES